MTKLFLLLASTFNCFLVSGQVNQVRNGGFEQYSHCPNTADQIRFAYYWTPIDTNNILMHCAPEYCNKCDSTTSFSVPKGVDYYHVARSSEGMAHARLYFNNNYFPYSERDYLQGQFFTNLVAAKTYCVTFYVAQTQGSRYAINKIGAYIDNGAIDAGQDSVGYAYPQTAFVPQITTDSVLDDTLNWMKIQGSYTATGNEKYITIGNFVAQADVDTVKRGWIVFCTDCSYYLIDDVSVIESTAVANAGADQWVSPGSDSAFIGIHDEGLPTAWYIQGNPTPLCYGTGGFMVHPDTTTSYIVTLDLCGNITSDTVTVYVGRAGVPLLGSLSNTNVYPNPAGSTLHIDGATGCEVSIYDVVGNSVKHIGLLYKPNEIADISTLPKGIYFLEAQNHETGERAVKKFVKE